MRTRRANAHLKRKRDANSTTTNPNGAVLRRTAPLSSMRHYSGVLETEKLLGCEHNSQSGVPRSVRSRGLSLPTLCPACRAKSIRLFSAVNLVIPFANILDPRHRVRLFRLPATARSSSRCDATSRSPSVVHQPAMREAAFRVDCGSRFPKAEFDPFHTSSPFHPFHWARLRGNSCARRLRVFCFSVSSQKISRTDAGDFLCPSRNADSRLGSRPLSLSSAPITRAKRRFTNVRKSSRTNGLFG
jgi:hypothetical protein